MILGITGGTGCGKTTLLNLIEELGGLVLDCDAIYHRLLQTDKAMLCAIEDRFPGTVTDGVLDRKKLGSLVFSNESALQDLNAITHNAVRQQVLLALQTQPKLAAIDAIGLCEGGLADLCHTTIAITAPRDARIARLIRREDISKEYAIKRIDAQHSTQWFASRCDHVLENDGTPAQFRHKCLAFLHGLGIIEEKP